MLPPINVMSTDSPNLRGFRTNRKRDDNGVRIMVQLAASKEKEIPPSTTSRCTACRYGKTGGIVHSGCPVSRSANGPEINGKIIPGSTCTSNISSIPVVKSRWAAIWPVHKSTTIMPHFNRSRRATMGTPSNDGRAFESPTKAYLPCRARPRAMPGSSATAFQSYPHYSQLFPNPSLWELRG